MIPVRVTVDDSRGMQRIARMRGRFARLGEVFEGPVQDLIRDFLDAQFATEGEAGGEAWEPLKESTILRKLKAGAGDKGILERTGDLREGIESGAFLRFETSRNRLVFDIESRVAGTHQEGTGRMVARPLLPDEMPPTFIRELRNIVTGYLVEGRVSEGFGS